MTRYSTRDESCRPRSGDSDRERASSEREGGSDESRERSHRSRGRGRKERVLHTRISEELSEDIRRFAEDLRVPASNLVRNVLEEVFSVVETVSDNMGDLFDDLLEEADDARGRIHRQMDQREDRHRRREGSRGDSHRRRRERHHRRHRRGPDDVEEELRRDEAAEAAQGAKARGEGESKDSESTNGKPRKPKEFPDVLGWQPLVLNREQQCADCGCALGRGDRAFLGVKSGGLCDLALCAACVRA